MQTTDCSTFETLIENGEPIELIDVRPRKEFLAMHIPKARSVPFAELANPQVFSRRRPTTDRVYVIAKNRMQGSLAAGILRASGYLSAVPIEGGMEAWVAQDFPVVHKRSFLSWPILLEIGAGLQAIGAGITFAVGRIAVSVLTLLTAAALLVKSCFGDRKLMRASAFLNFSRPFPLHPSIRGAAVS